MTKDFNSYFIHTEEYPTEPAINILPMNVCWEYMSVTFLNAFINYVRPMKAYLIDRYSDDEEKRTQLYSKFVNKTNFHTDLSKLGDDVLLLAKVPKVEIPKDIVKIDQKDNTRCGYDPMMSGRKQKCCTYLMRGETDFRRSNNIEFYCRKFDERLSHTFDFEHLVKVINRCQKCKDKYQTDTIIDGTSEGRFDKSFYYFWFDRDISDCCIGRFHTKDSEEVVMESFHNHVMEVQKSQKVNGKALVLPIDKFTGGISF